MLINDKWPLIGLFTVLSATYASAITCASCEGETEEECDQNQTYQICTNSSLNQCMNVSYTYISKNNTKQSVFRRACMIVNVHWGKCDFACLAPKRYQSTDCKPQCCSEDNCNVRPKISSSGVQIKTSQNYAVLTVALSLAINYIMRTPAIT